MTVKAASRPLQISARVNAALPYFLAAIIALPAGLRLLQAGFWTSGDGMHHLHRVAALTGYLQQSIFYPRWIGDFSFGYGAPVFNFYSPLSYYAAQAFSPLGAVWAMKLTMLAGLIASAVLMYHFAQGHLGRWPALAAVAVYALAPYRFVDLYPRAALAEHMAFLWLPLILWSFDGIWEGKRRGWQVAGWAGLVLTHSFTALMFAPFFALYLLWQAAARRQWRPLLTAGLSLALAIAVTAFFWLPLGLESKYAGLGAAEIGQGYTNHLMPVQRLPGSLLFDYSTGGGRPDYYFAFGLVMTLVLLAAIPALWLVRRQRRTVQLAAFGVVTGLLALFMVSRASTPVWHVLAPVLANIQFPWRFLSIATLGGALAATGLVAAVRNVKLQAAIVVGLAAALYTTSAVQMPFEAKPLAASDITPEKLWEFDRETGQAGTTWGGEFIPVGVKEQRWLLGRAPEKPMDGPAMPQVIVRASARRGDRYTLLYKSEVPWTFRYHAFYFPGWQVRVNGQAVPTFASGDLGLVTAEIPPGNTNLEVGFEPTAVRRVAFWVTLASLLLMGVASVWDKGSFSFDRLGWFVYALIVLLTSGGLFGDSEVRSGPVHWLTATFGDRAQLIGAEFPTEPRKGGELPVDLLWFASRQVSTNDKAFIHLVDAGGQVVAQSDSDPGGGFTPTTRWQPGELIPDRHRIALPDPLAPGTYRLMAGLYQFEPLKNLLTDPPNPDGRVLLGEVEIR